MRNLDNREKKLLSRAGIILAGILVLAIMHFSAVSIVNYFKDYTKYKEQKVIELYEKRVDSITKINETLEQKIQDLDKEITFLQNNKIIIYKKYNEKINTIYDANAADHALWLESILIELKTNKQFNK